MARLMVVFIIFREFITPTLLKIWILGGSADALFDFGFVMKLTVKSNSQIEDTDPKVLAVQVSQYNIVCSPKVPIYVVWSYPDMISKPNLCKPRTQYASLFWSLPTATVSITLHLWQSVHIYFDTSIFGRVSFSISVGWHGLKNMSYPSPSPLHRKVSFFLYWRVYSSVGEFLPQRVSFPSVGEFLPLWVGADWRPSLIFPQGPSEPLLSPTNSPSCAQPTLM